MSPETLSDQEKSFVISKIKEMAPLYRSIDIWINTLLSFGSERDAEIVRKLHGMVINLIIETYDASSIKRTTTKTQCHLLFEY